LNVRVLKEDNIDDVKGNIYVELERVFDKFAKYHTKILRDFKAKAGRADIFKHLGRRVRTKLEMILELE
jgi:hypothetical protein